MIPFFYKRYEKAPLATFISLLSSLAFLLAVLFSVGYFFNWQGIKDEVPLQECLIASGCGVVAGFVLMKWAAWLARRKYRKMVERAGTAEYRAQPAQPQAAQAARPAYQAQATQTSRPEPARPAEATNGASARFCPKCGTKAEVGDAFCVNCGAKLANRASTPQADTFQAHESHTYERPTPPQETPAAKQDKPKSTAVRLLVTLAILALAFFGGRWLSEQMVSRPANVGSTQETEGDGYYTWQPPVDPFEALPKLISIEGNYGVGWDIMGATDFDINQATQNCFSGSVGDRFGALFMDANGDRGGFIYEHGDDLFAWFGSWRRTSTSMDELTLIDTAGESHKLELKIYSNDSICVLSAEGRAIQFNMERGEDQRANLINLMTNVRDGKYS